MFYKLCLKVFIFLPVEIHNLVEGFPSRRKDFMRDEIMISHTSNKNAIQAIDMEKIFIETVSNHYCLHTQYQFLPLKPNWYNREDNV